MENEVEVELDKLLEEGKLHFSCYDYEKAEEVINQAIKISNEHNRLLKKVEALSYLGYMHAKEIGDEAVIRKSYLECIKILKKIAPTSRNQIAWFYSRIGMTYYSTNTNKLINYHEKCLEFLDADTINYTTHARINKNLGDAYKKNGNLKKAEVCYLKSLQINIAANPNSKNERTWAHYIQNLSNFYKSTGNESKSIEFNKRYEEAFKKSALEKFLISYVRYRLKHH